jgi:diketogulonate reductase-like aldo/keto reductase
MRTIQVQGVSVPTFLYGTAWKEDETQRLVTMAIEVGFTGIDTANQRRHYHEAAVGAGIRQARRESLFLQTKFTHQAGQDDRLPYDPAAPLPTQVAQSFESSLQHLHTQTIDSYLLHGPSARYGFPPEDFEVWTAMEELHTSGRAQLIGVSNVSLEQISLLCSRARVPPAMVQNRCYARMGWDREVRAFCREHGMAYQGFSLLTANIAEIRSPTIGQIAARLGRTPAQVVFRFALQVGMVCLTGSTDRQHVKEDLDCYSFELTSSDVEAIEKISG